MHTIWHQLRHNYACYDLHKAEPQTGQKHWHRPLQSYKHGLVTLFCHLLSRWTQRRDWVILTKAALEAPQCLVTLICICTSQQPLCCHRREETGWMLQLHPWSSAQSPSHTTQSEQLGGFRWMSGAFSWLKGHAQTGCICSD